MANDRRMTLEEWQALAALTLARSRSARANPQARTRTTIRDDDDWSGLSVPEIIRREKARIRKENAVRVAREKILSGMVKDAERGFGPLTPRGIVQDFLDRAAEESHRENPRGIDRYTEWPPRPPRR